MIDPDTYAHGADQARKEARENGEAKPPTRRAGDLKPGDVILATLPSGRVSVPAVVYRVEAAPATYAGAVDAYWRSPTGWAGMQSYGRADVPAADPRDGTTGGQAGYYDDEGRRLNEREAIARMFTPWGPGTEAEALANLTDEPPRSWFTIAADALDVIGEAAKCQREAGQALDVGEDYGQTVRRLGVQVERLARLVAEGAQRAGGAA